MIYRRRQPKGTPEGTGLKIAVKFNPELFKRISERAVKHKKSFSQMVNETCECGLLDLEESEADDPVYLAVG
jgi:peptide subunit release factor RF-3